MLLQRSWAQGDSRAQPKAHKEGVSCPVQESENVDPSRRSLDSRRNPLGFALSVAGCSTRDRAFTRYSCIRSYDLKLH